MKRQEFRRLALIRLDDARALLRARRYAGAYYLAGYAVECGLKACVAQTFKAATIPGKGEVDKIYTHNLPALVRYAGLDTALTAAIATDADFQVNWTITLNWKEQTRYERERSQAEAASLAAVIADPTHGLLRWIRQHW